MSSLGPTRPVHVSDKHSQPLLHLRAVAKNRFWRVNDVVLTVFGFVAMAYTTILTVKAWANDTSGPKLPSYCDPDGGN